LSKENPLKMSEFLKNNYFLNEKSPKKAFISHRQLNKKKINSFAKKIFYSKISKKGIFLQNSVRVKNNSIHLTNINFTENKNFLNEKSPSYILIPEKDVFLKDKCPSFARILEK
jgi:hypothetical protein